MLFWFVLVPILIAALLYILPFERSAKIIAIITQTILCCCTFYLFLLCKDGDIITKIGNYSGVLGIMLKADNLSSVFLLLTSFTFLIAVIYSFHEGYNRLYWFLLFIWEGLLIGIFLSNDLFNLFVHLEVAVVVVSILIMFNRDNRSMYDGMFYLMINTVVIQFYLLGVGYIYKLTGVLDLDLAAEAVKSLDKTSIVLPYALVMTTISLKCALVPLFSWLPKAHGSPGAPSAVSAILSGLHVKCGIYLFIRFQIFFQDIAFSYFFLYVGIVTGIIGFIFALSQKDIKLILAYHTISQIGMIMIGLNIDNYYSYTGGIYHIFNHAFFKSALFFSAGIIAKIYGTRDINKIRGVLKRFPLVGVATLMAICGISGAPFFNGSISKYFIMSGTNWLVSGAMMLINLGTIISFIKYSSILFGSCENMQEKIVIKPGQQAAIIILGTVCLIGGIFGEQAIEFLFNISVSVDAAGYLEKIVLFTVSLISGYLIYKFYISKSRFFKRIHEIELSFRWICIFIGIFFAVIIIVQTL